MAGFILKVEQLLLHTHEVLRLTVEKELRFTNCEGGGVVLSLKASIISFDGSYL